MNEFIAEMIVYLVIILKTFILGVLLNVITKCKDKLKAEIVAIQNEDERNLLINALSSIDRLTKNTVYKIEQTEANQLRKLIKEGQAPKYELEQLSIFAFDEISNSIRPEHKKVIGKYMGNFSTYLTNCIETNVLELKSIKK